MDFFCRTPQGSGSEGDPTGSDLSVGADERGEIRPKDW